MAGPRGRPVDPMVKSDPSDPWEFLHRVPMGRRVEILSVDGRLWTGTLVPAHELSGERIVQLKLDSGYNVGVRIDSGARVRFVDSEIPAAPLPESRPTATGPARRAAAEPGTIALLTTGGTIASRVDYRTGGVRPVSDERGLLEFYPGLSRDGPVRVVPVFDRLSEEIGPAEWETLARHVLTEFGAGAQGVVIAHGTDTLAYTAAALGFLLEDLTGPVVLVGAQRSPDRPSSDGVSNLLAATKVARHGSLAEVVVVMHEGISDTRFAVHRGTRVRKMHSSRRDAFRTRNASPLGWVENSDVHLNSGFRARSPGPVRISGKLDTSGVLLWFYPGLTAEKARSLVAGSRGAVIAGTGLGHMSTRHLPWIRELVQAGGVVAMTTQCLEGEVDPYVYSTGRELWNAGVLYLGDMLPETAYVKLLWALGRSTDPEAVRSLLKEDRAGEYELRHQPEATE